MTSSKVVTSSFVTLLYCVCVCGVGASFFTYDGVNSSTQLSTNQIAERLLSFSVRTRRRDQLLFAAYDPSSSSSSDYFVVGMKDGKVMLKGNFSGTVVVVEGICSLGCYVRIWTFWMFRLFIVFVLGPWTKAGQSQVSEKLSLSYKRKIFCPIIANNE